MYKHWEVKRVKGGMKMNRIYRILCTIVVTAVLISSFVGCTGNKEKNESNSQATTTKNSSEATVGTTEKVEELAPVKLTMILLGDKTPDNDKVYDKVNEKLSKDINATVETSCISWSDWTTKYPLMFASGEYFDMIYTSNWAFYGQQALKGGFYELTPEMLKKYAPMTYANVTEDQWTQTKVNGKIYMLPMTYKECAKDVFIIRGDLRKKYSIPEIKTKDDLVQYWDAILANEKTMIPCALGNQSSSDASGAFFLSVFTSFPDELFSKDYIAYNSVGYNVALQSFDYSDPGNVKVLDTSKYEINDYKLMHEFQQKGYWSKNALNQSDSSLTLFASGKSASGNREIYSIGRIYSQVMKEHPEWEPEVVDINPGKPCKISPVTNNGTGIHATSKYPERALMALDLFGYDREYFDLTWYGIEGVNWTPEGSDGYKQLNTDFGGAMAWTTSLKRKLAPSFPNYDTLVADFEKNGYTPILGMMNFDDSNVKNQVAAVNAVFSKYNPILTLGFANDVEAEYKQMNDELKQAGIEQIRAEYLKQAQAFMSSYGK